jgi:flagellar biosynthetic protein FliR
LSIGGDQIYLKALNQSFELIPLGQVAVTGGAETVIASVGQLFVIGVQMSSPFIVSLLLLDVAFAIFAKMMPQANIFFIAMPLKVGAGIIMLWLVVPRLAIAFQQYFDQMWVALEKIIAVLGGGG